MSRSALRFCAEPGCPEKVTSGRCSRHHRVKRQHETRFQVGNYGRPWRRLREAFIQQELAAGRPFCVECVKQGKDTPFDEVDHIVPHRGDPALRDDIRNLQLLCTAHHSAKTAREVLSR